MHINWCIILFVFLILLPLASADYYDVWHDSCDDESNYEGMCARGEWGNVPRYQGDRCLYKWKESGIGCDAHLVDVATKELSAGGIHSGTVQCSGEGVGCYIDVGTCNQGTCQLATCDIDSDGDKALSCIDNIWPGHISSPIGVAGPNQYTEEVDTDYGGVVRKYNSPISYITDCDDNDASINSMHYNPRASDVESVSIDFPREIVGSWFKIESYKDRTERDRKFTPQAPYSPYDDIEISIKFRKHLECNTRWDLNGGKIAVLADGGELFKTSYFEVVEVYENYFNKGNLPDERGFYTPGTPESVRWSSSIKGKNPEYRVILRGWPNGITQNEADMEALILAISLGKTITLRIEDKNGNKIETPEIPMTNCARTYGEGKHGVVHMRGLSAGQNPQDMISASNSLRENAFNKIYPFNNEISSFSFFADLIEDNDPLITRVTAYHASQVSSCGSDKSLYVYYTNEFMGRSNRAYSTPGVNGIYMPPYRAGFSDALVELHEASHSFCGLYDEYPPTGMSIYQGIFNRKSLKNCADSLRGFNEYDLLGFVKDGKRYSDAFPPCFTVLTYRASEDSLMGTFSSPEAKKYNIPSCSACLASIRNNKDWKAYFDECKDSNQIVEPIVYSPLKRCDGCRAVGEGGSTCLKCEGYSTLGKFCFVDRSKIGKDLVWAGWEGTCNNVGQWTDR